MFHNCYILNILPVNHKCYFVTFENLDDKKKYSVFLEIFFILKIDQLTAFSPRLRN